MSQIQQLESKLKRDPHDAAAWHALVEESLRMGNTDATRNVFERLLAIYPTAGVYWRRYAEFEFGCDHDKEVVAIFSKALNTVYSVDLYEFYLHYIFSVNTNSNGLAASPESHGTIVQAFEFVVNRVGIDRNAGPIWSRYLAYLKSLEPMSQMDEQRKIDDLRMNYQRAIVIPTNHLEKIWKEYDAFENGLNRFAAKKYLAEKSPAYMTARTAYREIRSIFDPVSKSEPPFSLPVPPTWSRPEMDYLNAWKRYLAWEKTNPLRLEEAEVNHRLSYAYKQALLALRFYPEVWVEAGQHRLKCDGATKALETLKEATEVLPKSSLVHFVYADELEAAKDLTGMAAVYDGLTTRLTTAVEALKAREERQLQRVRDAVSARTGNRSTDRAASDGHSLADDTEPQAKRSRVDASEAADPDSELSDEDIDLTDLPGGDTNGAGPGGIPDLGGTVSATRADGDDSLGDISSQKRAVEKFLQARLEAVRHRYASRVDPLIKELTTVNVVHMRAVRRSEGNDAFRKLFSRLRRQTHVTYHVYVASAMVEYYFNKDVTVAGRVFEVGLKLYDKEPDYVGQYLYHLIRINDDTNAQALFERAVTNLTIDQARDIWDMFLDYQTSYGDIQASRRLEERFLATYPTETLRDRLQARYSVAGLDTLATQELGIERSEHDHNQRPVDHHESAGHAHPPSQVVSQPPHGRLPGSTGRPVADDAVGLPGAGEHVVIPSKHNMEGFDRGPIPKAVQRRQVLVSVTPEKFARPNFSEWMPFKVEPEATGADSTSSTHKDAGMDTDEYHVASPAASVTANRSPVDILQAFLSCLPPPHLFNGPPFPPELILHQIRQVNIPEVTEPSALSAALDAEPGTGSSGGANHGPRPWSHGAGPWNRPGRTGSDARHPPPQQQPPPPPPQPSHTDDGWQRPVHDEEPVHRWLDSGSRGRGRGGGYGGFGPRGRVSSC
ncbi:mRNA 3'-end-processing protein rna14 [Tieghemiomyces parasiticus]|uniref:mRNA 3'-end-processing protein rna14 n=1 Tax=Tieghemiomyces parasiticus TaxID=78921 RepID=A0A9W8E078_9FUNG|nr:mRNA 3'-end-processing protein rna14 [Tieghemiomyces parasiticus]